MMNKLISVLPYVALVLIGYFTGYYVSWRATFGVFVLATAAVAIYRYFKPAQASTGRGRGGRYRDDMTHSGSSGPGLLSWLEGALEKGKESTGKLAEKGSASFSARPAFSIGIILGLIALLSVVGAWFGLWSVSAGLHTAMTFAMISGVFFITAYEKWSVVTGNLLVLWATVSAIMAVVVLTHKWNPLWALLFIFSFIAAVISLWGKWGPVGEMLEPIFFNMKSPGVSMMVWATIVATIVISINEYSELAGIRIPANFLWGGILTLVASVFIFAAGFCIQFGKKKGT